MIQFYSVVSIRKTSSNTSLKIHLIKLIGGYKIIARQQRLKISPKVVNQIKISDHGLQVITTDIMNNRKGVKILVDFKRDQIQETCSIRMC